MVDRARVPRHLFRCCSTRAEHERYTAQFNLMSETRHDRNDALHWRFLPTWALSFEQRCNSSRVRGDGKNRVGPDSMWEGLFRKKAGNVSNQTKSWFGRIVVAGSLVLLASGGFVTSNIASATSTTPTTAVSSVANDKVVVTGSLRVFGGVADTPLSGSPVAGRVVFKPTQGVAHALKVGKSGKFRIALPAGTYKAYGGPPAWGNKCLVNGGKPFKLEAGHSLKVVVACMAL